MIILMAGLPGTGKSTLAEALAVELSGTVLSKDKIRHAIFAPRHVEYSTEQDDFCMELMLQAAAYILKKDADRFVFLDGRTFSRRCQVERVIDFANGLGQAWRILECVCSEETAKTRLSNPLDHPAQNRDLSLYREVKRRFEEITAPKMIVDTGKPLADCIAAILEFLKA